MFFSEAIGAVWIQLKLRLRFLDHVSFFFFLFLFLVFTRFGVMRLLFMYCLLNSSHKCWLFHSKQYIHALFMDPQILLFSNFFIKNGFHGTIYTFKNYFTTVFSVFSFQFQQNKLCPDKLWTIFWSKYEATCLWLGQ